MAVGLQGRRSGDRRIFLRGVGRGSVPQSGGLCVRYCPSNRADVEAIKREEEKEAEDSSIISSLFRGRVCRYHSCALRTREGGKDSLNGGKGKAPGGGERDEAKAA